MRFRVRHVLLALAGLLTVTSAGVFLDHSSAQETSDDGYILYTAYGQRTAYQVFRIRADGTDKKRLTPKRQGGNEPSWSPDGTRIAYSASSGIMVMKADGSRRRPFTSRSNDSDPEWSPDGERIAFFRCERCNSEGSPSSRNLFTKKTAGSGLRQLTDFTRAVPAEAAWSPDGSRLAYIRQGLQTAIQVVSRSGGDPRTVVVGRNILSYDWSPDGTRIVFDCLCEGDEESDLYEVDVDSGVVTTLTDTAEAEQDPRWNPDGQRVLFVRWELDGAGLFVVETLGLLETRLTSGMRAVPEAEWSPDGSMIAYVRWERADLFKMSADGTGKERLTHDGLDQIQPQWQPRF